MIRKFIRKKVQKVLSDDVHLKQVISGVHCRRSFSSDDGELPVILIYPLNESVDPFNQAPKEYKRYYEYVIEIISRHDTDDELCDELDDLSYMVEKAIEGDPVLRGWKPYSNDGHCLEETFATSVQSDQQGDGSSPIGAVRMTFNSVYVADPINKIALEDFKGVDIQWNIGDHGENKAIDKVDLPIV